MGPSPVTKSRLTSFPPSAEQEDFIRRLSAENSSRNAFFVRILMALPLAVALPYIPALFRPPTTLLALLGLTSLLSTSFLLYRLPHNETGIAILDLGAGSPNRRPKEQQLGPDQAVSPLDKYLPYLNAALVTLLFLMGMVMKSDSPSFGWVGMGNLPAIVYAVVIIAKRVMASVDPESELSHLKYQYKGA